VEEEEYSKRGQWGYMDDTVLAMRMEDLNRLMEEVAKLQSPLLSPLKINSMQNLKHMRRSSPERPMSRSSCGPVRVSL
jgi:hypothetical protein